MARKGGKSTAARGAGSEAVTTPAELLAAPGYVARRLYQSYVALWTRAVDPVLTGPQYAVLTAVDTVPAWTRGRSPRRWRSTGPRWPTSSAGWRTTG